MLAMRVGAPLLLLLLMPGCAPKPVSESPEIDVTTLSVAQLQAQLASADLSAITLTRAYLDRIALIDDTTELNAIIEINPDALEIAAELDRHLASSGPVGPLHGLPVVLKANIDTADAMTTSAGSLALAHHYAASDAFVVQRLRAAGAVILAKTNLSEWANFRDSESSSGWSSLGGQSRNPHVLDRNPCGSSSGSAAAVAASLAPLAVGTETNGSIVCPAGYNGIVGIKPTLGTVSRQGIIPISHSQDTAGPMAQTVTAAALLLESMIGVDPADAAAVAFPDAAGSLLPDASIQRLDGTRIGVLRTYFGQGSQPATEAIYQASVETLAELGATLVDPINYLRDEAQRKASYQVLLYEFKAGLNAYLDSHSVGDDVDSLADLIVFNEAYEERVMPHFGQSIFHDAQAKGGLQEAAYAEARTASIERLRRDVDALFAEQELDALVIPVNGTAWKTDWLGGDNYTFGGTAYLAAVTGYPSIVVPAGAVRGLPIALGFVGRAFAEREIIQIAYVFEQATNARISPQFIASLEADTLEAQ